ncbi:primosomal protein DnaI [Alkalicoccus chagannorensis]|uniref:primosomal protein DnaI n=1 Tax=Alkalicoccus chagannorensis TaxID=427072 RepID=UPI00040C31F8|nr:primosomal protein DnaI [Alkalicoccus chagannorensis]
MDPIKKPLDRFQDNRLQERLSRLRQEVLEHPYVQRFLEEEKIDEETAEASLNELYEYKQQWENCSRCPGLDACPNLMRGYQPVLEVHRGSIHTVYQSCPLKKREDEQRRHQSFMKSLYLPKEMLKVRFEDVEKDNTTRTKAKLAALAFCAEIAPGEKADGLYIHGPFGVGKTFLVSAIANELADNEMETMLVYTPDFIRELKAGISDGSYQEKLDNVKRAPVLILDDIGAETMSAWVRDEVFGALLQFRMMEKLPTVFTSNFDLEELEMHLSSTTKGGVEKVEQLKAGRIMERIRHLTEEVAMEGKNRRRQ